MRSMATHEPVITGTQRAGIVPEIAVPGAPMPGNRTPPAAASMARRGPLMVYLAALVALAGIPIHLYWALGGTWGLPAARPPPS